MLNFKDAHVLDLTPAEIKLVQLMAAGGSFTQATLASNLKISQNVISNRLKSIIAKTAIVIEEESYPKKYKLTPEGRSILLRTDVGLIKLDGLTTESTDTVIGGLECSLREIIGVPIGIIINISNRIPSSLEVLGEKCKACKICTLFSSSTCKKPNIPITEQNQYAAA